MSNNNIQVSVVRQFRAIGDYPITGIWGALLGGLPVFATFILAYLWLAQYPDLKWLVYGGLVYSSFTVFRAMTRMQHGPTWIRYAKAAGFTLLMEGIMVTAPGLWMRIMVVAVSIAINALENGYTMVCDHIKAEQDEAENMARIESERKAEIENAVAVAVAEVHAKYAAEKAERKAKRQAKPKAEKPTKRRRNTAQRKAAETGKPVAVVMETNALVIPEGAEMMVAGAVEAAA